MLSCFFCHKNEDTGSSAVTMDFNITSQKTLFTIVKQCEELRSVTQHLLESWKAVAYVQSHIYIYSRGIQILGD